VMAVMYGTLIDNWTLIYCNGINALFGSYYIYSYHKYTRDKQKVRILFLIAIVFLLSVYYHVTVRSPGEEGIFQLGIIGNISTILMFASPLSTMTTVIKTGNASSIPAAFSLVSFLCSLAWVLMGIKLKDIFIALPNVVGMILSSFQLFLVQKYGQGKKIEDSSFIEV